MALIDTKNGKLLEANKAHLDIQFFVHSRNLSRSDTPGARAEYIEPFAQLIEGKLSRPTTVQATHQKHLHSKTTISGTRVKADKTTTNMTISGNNINPDTEMSKLSHLAAERRTITELQKTDLQLFSILLR